MEMRQPVQDTADQTRLDNKVTLSTRVQDNSRLDKTLIHNNERSIDNRYCYNETELKYYTVTFMSQNCCS